jgi:hypothetical protein
VVVLFYLLGSKGSRGKLPTGHRGGHGRSGGKEWDFASRTREGEVDERDVMLTFL